MTWTESHGMTCHSKFVFLLHLCFCLLGEAIWSDDAGEKWGEVEGKQDTREEIVVVIKVRGS